MTILYTITLHTACYYFITLYDHLLSREYQPLSHVYPVLNYYGFLKWFVSDKNWK